MKLQFHTDETLVSSNGNSGFKQWKLCEDTAKIGIGEHRKSHIVVILSEIPTYLHLWVHSHSRNGR